MPSQRTEGRPSVAGSLGLGVVGAGGFAHFVRDAIVTVDGLHVAAVCDVDPGRAEALAGLDGAVACTSFDELLSTPGVDAVLIATPPAQHAGMSLAALRAGKHVFCEKPAGMTPEEVAAVARAVADGDRAHVVDHVVHHNPLVQLLVRLRAAGVLDAVQRFVFENDAGDSDLGPDHWFWQPGHAGGIFIEHGVHFFDVARLLDGTPEVAVQAMAHERPDGRVDTVVATVRHQSGALATHAHGFSHANPTERQLMRVDMGLAEARLEGWIPLSLVLDAWVDEAGLAALQQVVEDPSWLAVPGFTPGERQQVHLDVLSAPMSLRTHDVDHAGRIHVRLRAQLGEPDDKQEVYRQSVCAALTDLLLAVHEGRTPSAGIAEGAAAVEVAHAATRALEGVLVDVEVRR